MFDFYEIFKEKNPGFIGIRDKTYSVVIPIIDIDGQQNIIFQIRNKNLKVQPGEVSLPGGRVEEGEKPIEAAIREFSEEMSSSPNKIKIISELDTYVAPVRGIIHCFLAEIDKDIDLDIKNEEVEGVFTVPITYFIKNEPKVFRNRISIQADENFPFDEMSISKKYNWGSYEYPVAFYKIDKIVIWGITANIIWNFSKNLT